MLKFHDNLHLEKKKNNLRAYDNIIKKIFQFLKKNGSKQTTALKSIPSVKVELLESS